MNGITSRGGRTLAWLFLAAWALPATSHAQAPAEDTTTTPAVAPAPVAPRGRLSWTSDRLPVRVGDLVTVTVDEQAEAREHVSKVSSGDRGMKASLKGNIDTGGASPSRYDVGFNTGFGTNSRDVGDAQRTGGLSAVLTVRVTALESDGVARIEGHKMVTVDGRTQDVMLRGLIRTQDVLPGNTIYSSRIADAAITYKGKKIAPNGSFVGKLFGMVWP